MITDPIGDLLIRIKNGYMVGKETVEVPYSRNKEILSGIFNKLGYLESVKVNQKGKLQKLLLLKLRYVNKEPSLNEISRVSKPSRRTYTGKNKIPKVLGGKGYVILSTPEGFMTGDEARRKGLGGEIICKFW